MNRNIVPAADEQQSQDYKYFCSPEHVIETVNNQKYCKVAVEQEMVSCTGKNQSL